MLINSLYITTTKFVYREGDINQVRLPPFSATILSFYQCPWWAKTFWSSS